MLFEASWIWAPPWRLAPFAPEPWERVTTAAGLARWEAAWAAFGSATDRRVFPPSLLGAPDMAFFGRASRDGNDGGFDAGCIANLSPGCVGLSNVFARRTDEGLAAEAASAACAFGRGLPVVGYERGAELDAFRACGFEAVGPLRVWVGGG